MTQWRVTWTKTAENYYDRMEEVYKQRLQRAIRELEADPFSSKKVKKLHGELKGLYRYRIGRFRILYRIMEKDREVRILAIASRGDVYK